MLAMSRKAFGAWCTRSVSDLPSPLDWPGRQQMYMSIWPKGGKDNKVMIAPKGVFSLLSGVLAKGLMEHII